MSVGECMCVCVSPSAGVCKKKIKSGLMKAGQDSFFSWEVGSPARDSNQLGRSQRIFRIKNVFEDTV